jgi:hypothetical protein
VVRPPAGEHDPAVGLAAREVRGAGELERGLDRLGAAGHRVDRRIVDRQVPADLLRVALQGLGRERGSVRVREAGGLLGGGIRDLAPPMPDADDDRAPGGVEVLAAVGVDDGGALCRDGDRRVGRGGAAEDAAAHRRSGRTSVITRRL